MTLVAIVAVILVGVLSQPAFGTDAGCKNNPRLTGKCHILRGSVLMSGDIGPVLDPDGHAGRLIIRSAPDSSKDMPLIVENILEKDLFAEIHGTYEVCPIPVLPSQFPPESTRFACINAASHVSVSEFDRQRNSH